MKCKLFRFLIDIHFRINISVILTILAIPYLLSTLAAQEYNSLPNSLDNSVIIHGSVADKNTGTPLPYANIYAMKTGKGVISNEKGLFTMDIGELADSDTIRFQYIGYKTLHATAAELRHDPDVLLEEEIFNLNETIVYGSMPDLVSIVKNVLVYKDSNYRKVTHQEQVFIRDRDMADLEQMRINFRKSSIEQLDRKVIEGMEERFPKYMTSYNDFLGRVYYSANEEDSIRLKIEPIRAVSLKQEDMEVFEQMNTIFKSLVENTGEDEYWKVRSGIFGDKLELEEDDTTSMEVDSLKDFRTNVDLYRGKIGYQRRFSTFGDEDQWEFLHKTGRYKYSLVGGTRVNGEEVYIIDFIPKGNGRYEGRMFIASETYALVRADFNYAEGKTGRDFHLLGLGYTENQFDGSIYFEKREDTYQLKYFSFRQGSRVSVDRSVILKKKKERWLFDKSLKELKIGIEMIVNTRQSIEYLILDQNRLSSEQFHAFSQPEKMEIIYVDQFDENLWRGYSIIEPTEQMREYRKQEVNFVE